MPKRRSKSSRKRKQKIKLPVSVVVALVVIVLIAAGIYAYLHPYEARQYVETWIAQLQGKPTTGPAAPIPATDGSDNLAFGIPGPADTIIDREGYALGYSEYHEQPAWVIYHMTAEEATTKATSREDNFRPDPEIPTGSATLADYRGSGFDRGHLAPAADMAFSVKTMDESFYMSNMSPQRGEFNRGIGKIAGRAGQIVRHHGKGRLHSHRPGPSEEKILDYRREPGHRTRLLLQGRLGQNGADENDWFRVAERGELEAVTVFRRDRGCRRSGNRAGLLLGNSTTAAGAAGKHDYDRCLGLAVRLNDQSDSLDSRD